MKIMKGKWRSRNKDFISENNNKRSSDKKTYRIYLVEPHDYFGIRNMQKTYQQQISLAQQRIEDDVPHFNAIGTEPTRPCKEDDLRILRRSIRPSPPTNYDGRGRRDSFGEAERIRRGDVAVSIPVRKIIASRLKSYYNDFIRRRNRKEHQQQLSFNSDGHPLMTSTNSPCESLRSRRSSLSSRRTRTITETSTETTDSDVFNYIQMRKQVHFGQNTIYSEYSGSSMSTTSDSEDREPGLSWTERRRRRAQRKAEMEEMNRPKPLLPFLEAGLSYRNEEEFYKLKNAHQNPQLLKEIQQKNQKSQRQRNWSQFLRSFPCFCSSHNEKSL